MQISVRRHNFPESTFMNWLREKSPEHLTLDINQFLFSESRKHISECVTLEDINSWRTDTPIIISAQTGSGKNYFIFKILLRYLLQKNQNKKNKKNTLLFLVNRVALSRQNKFYLTDELKKLLGNEKYEQTLKFFTNEGIDNLYLDFGAVTVCTYHQCYKSGMLNEKSFEYIVCDECHFFTSDSTFNLETDLILKDIIKNGQNSIRIYMSATPETALEPILKFECDYRKSLIDKWAEEIKLQNKPDVQLHFLRRAGDPNLPPLKIHGLSGNDYDIYQIKDYDSMLEKAVEKEYDALKPRFKVYYLSRNYHYLNFQDTYSEIEDLIPNIKQSKNKWLVFINNNDQAKQFKKSLTQEEITCEFVSRDSINSNDEVREEFDYIIENETFHPQVLIATSVIDNGINIRNDGKQIKNAKDKVLNIAIDATDRTQFLQMIGRVRVSEDDSINLYIKSYDVDELKEIVKQYSRTLVRILNNDFLNPEDQQNFFDGELFRYNKLGSENFSSYNVCAVYQLVNNICDLLKIIRNNEPDFLIPMTGHIDNIRKDIYLKYVNNISDSWSKIWSRSVVDILESADNTDIRKNFAEEDLRHNVIENHFKSTIGDTFTRYLFSKLLSDDVQRIIDQRFQNLVQYCFHQVDGHCTLNQYNTLVKRAESDKNASLSIEEKIDILKQMCFGQLTYIESFKSEYNDIQSTIENFKWMSNGKESTLIEAQCKWLERPDWIELIPSDPIKELDNYDTIEEYIQVHYVTEEQFENNKCSTDSDKKKNRDKCQKNFVKDYGIFKNSKLAKAVSQKYFNGKNFKDLLNKEWDINEFKYILKSVSSQGNNQTYYLFVRYSKNLEKSVENLREQ